jgi:flagellar motor switch protein FliN/FliY
MAETQEDVTVEQAQAVADAKVSAQTAEFEEAVDTASASGENLNILLDIQMPITVVIGKTEVPFKRLLQLSPGSVMELDKAVGSPADLYVQDIRLATGDIVVVNDSYGIRIRQVMGGETVRNVKNAANEKSQKS